MRHTIVSYETQVRDIQKCQLCANNEGEDEFEGAIYANNGVLQSVEFVKV